MMIMITMTIIIVMMIMTMISMFAINRLGKPKQPEQYSFKTVISEHGDND